MKILIAPAKKMIVDTDSFPVQNLPIYLANAGKIIQTMQKLDYEEAKKLWHCSDKIARSSYDILQQTDLNHHLTPAILAYSGIQYQYMAPDLFTSTALEYAANSVRILSGLYGILRPFDGITTYRLEMQAKLSIAGYSNLYQFWNNQIYQALAVTKEPIINLASKEYAKAISPYLTTKTPMIDIIFGTLIDNKIKTRATLAKMARGEMVRYMAENNVTKLVELKQFDHLDYHFAAEFSNQQRLVFLK